ncbi:DUF2007 domain-containing protein [Phenylobacterium sp.]|uniref:putative signal transducing protein n=1 Tax=Phenylobacterium sp. TaxID=1871053 RepID=UPI00286B1E69|nr:DUF2007 domain-containing protein [Phenylobacterium sp.]
MIAILETEDPVRLSYLKMILEAADLHPFIFDADTAYRQLPVRLMVPDSEVEQALRLIAEVEGAP